MEITIAALITAFVLGILLFGTISDIRSME
jgi:hypothetical protein